MFVVCLLAWILVWLCARLYDLFRIASFRFAPLSCFVLLVLRLFVRLCVCFCVFGLPVSCRFVLFRLFCLTFVLCLRLFVYICMFCFDSLLFFSLGLFVFACCMFVGCLFVCLVELRLLDRSLACLFSFASLLCCVCVCLFVPAFVCLFLHMFCLDSCCSDLFV